MKAFDRLVLVLLCLGIAAAAYGADGIPDRVVVRDDGGGLAVWSADASVGGGFGDGVSDSSGYFGLITDTPLLGDVNGDGIDDRILVRVNPGGYFDWFVDYSTTAGFGDGNADMSAPFGGSSFIPHAVVDMNNDGFDDRVLIDTSPGYNNYYVDLSGAAGFGDGNPDYSAGYGGTAMTPIAMGDLNGDGVADRTIDFDGTPSWASDLSNGPGFGDGNPDQWALFGGPGFPAFIDDATSDGYGDRVVAIPNGSVYDWAMDIAPAGGGMGDGNVDVYSTASYGITGDVLLYGDVVAAPQSPTNDNNTLALWHMESLVAVGAPLNSDAVLDDSTGVAGAHPRETHLGIRSGAPAINSNGAFGNALEFDGSDICYAYAAWWGEQLVHDSMGVEFWFNPAQIPASGYQVLIGAVAWEVRLFPTDDQNHLYIRLETWSSDEDGLQNVVVASPELAPNQWYHVVAEYQNGMQTLSVNGATNSESQSSLRLYTSDIYVGGSLTETGREYTGMIDEVKVYVPTLPGPTDAFLSPQSDDFSTIALWHFEEVTDNGSNLITPDDNMNNPNRQVYDGVLLEGWSGATGSQGPQIVPGMSAEFGNCLEFDGWNDRVLASQTDLGNNDDFRAEAWIKLDDSATSFGTDLYYSAAGQPYKFDMGIHDRGDGTWAYYARFWWDPAGGVLIEGTAADPHAWRHISAQWYKGQLSLFVDGQLADRLTLWQVTEMRATDNWAIIGSFSNDLFWGQIDDVLFRTATSSEATCGLYGYPTGDINQDCYVNFVDLGLLATDWLGAAGN